jgi:hypothetical protein
LHAVPIPHTFHRPVFIVVAAATVLIHIDYCVINGADDNNHGNHINTEAIQVWKRKGFRVEGLGDRGCRTVSHPPEPPQEANLSQM